MPTTVNGVGTHYYGRKNVTTRQGNCKSCNRQASLTSYDTRLWFVIIFIPVIPLGRKRIIDQCGSCKRHYVMDLAQWDEAQQLGISGAKAEYEKELSLDKAIAYHQTMVNFHELAAAEKFRVEMRERFGGEAKLHCYLGAVLNVLGPAPEAAQAYERAHELKPELPEARAGLAMVRMREGKLDDARGLLDFLEQPGAEQLHSLEPLEYLANAYQAKGRHAEALDLYQTILRGLPSVGEHPIFRKKMAVSEKALGKTESALPKIPFSFARLWHGPKKGWLIFGGLAISGCVVAAVHNEVTRRGETVYVVNAFSQPAKVIVDGVKTLNVPAHGREECLTLGEGKHQALISGPLDVQTPMEMSCGYFERWSGNVVWVLNIGGEATLVEEEGHYRADPVPTVLRFHTGQAFEKIPGVTHPFKELPKTVQMDKNEHERVLTKLDVMLSGSREAMSFLYEKKRFSEVMDMAEGILKTHPDNDYALNLYSSAGSLSNTGARVQNFLKPALSAVPLNITWHRAYQDSARADAASDKRELMAEYDALLAKDPGNGTLLYLRGRVEPTGLSQQTYFERSAKADAQLPWPRYALAYDLIMKGDWPKAQPLLDTTVQLAPQNEAFIGDWFLCHLGLKDYSALATSLRDQWNAKPRNPAAAYHLAECLAAQGDVIGLNTLTNEYQQSVAGQPNASLSVDAFRLFVLDVQGDLDGILKRTTYSPSTPQLRLARQQALLTSGRLDEAFKLLPSSEMGSNPYDYLAVSLAWLLKGDTKQADVWNNRAISVAKQAYGPESGLVKVLSTVATPNLEMLKALYVYPEERALLAAILAQRSTVLRPLFAEYGAKFDIRRNYPHAMIAKALAMP